MGGNEKEEIKDHGKGRKEIQGGRRNKKLGKRKDK